MLDYEIIWSVTLIGAALMSFALTPWGSPIIADSAHQQGISIQVVDDVEEFMEKIKEKNPLLRSLYLRFE